MKNLKFLLFVAVVSMSATLAAQQLPLFAVHRDHWNVLNPAALSNNYLINEMNWSSGASFRRQWLGVKDAPITQVANLETVLEDYNIVTGGHIINDQTGLIGQTGIYGQFAYIIQLGRRIDQGLVLGLSAGAVQYRAKLSEINFAEEEVGIPIGDRLLYPDFGLGAFYYYDDKFYAGLSVPQTFGLNTRFRTAEGTFGFKRQQHFYTVVGGYFDVTWFGNDASFVEPSLWLRYVPNAPLSADLNVRYQINELIWGGLSTGFGFGKGISTALRLDTGVVLGETLNIYNGQLKVGFAFDFPLNSYGPAFGNSMEINVIYSWTSD